MGLFMLENNLSIARAYYTEMSQKNMAGLEKYLHADVHFKGPLAEVHGKAAMLEAAVKFISLFKTLEMRTLCHSENQVMVVYDVDFPEPIGATPTAALLDVHNGLITKIELFFDARALENKRNDIFSQ